MRLTTKNTFGLTFSKNAVEISRQMVGPRSQSDDLYFQAMLLLDWQMNRAFGTFRAPIRPKPFLRKLKSYDKSENTKKVEKNVKYLRHQS